MSLLRAGTQKTIKDKQLFALTGCFLKSLAQLIPSTLEPYFERLPSIIAGFFESSQLLGNFISFGLQSFNFWPPYPP